MAVILRAETAEQIDSARGLMTEYVRSLPVDISHENFPQECARLPGDYAAPRGTLLLACIGGRAVGCAALRPLEGDTCEMKRVFLQPPFRGKGIGRELVDAAVSAARRIGYRRMRLDTIPALKAAVELYVSTGFRFIEPYRSIPSGEALFMELDLGGPT